jgi:hypothetical protein
MRPWRLVALVALVVAGCSQSASINDPSSMKSGSDWATPFLGTAPEATAVIVPPIALTSMPESDVRSPRVLRLDSPAEWGFRHCQQVDYYVSRGALGSGSTIIVVMHGVPTLLDPLRPYPEYECAHCERERSNFTFQGGAPSGARAYAARGRDKLQLFVVSPSTWIFASGVAGERLAIETYNHVVEPPGQPVSSGSIMDVWAPVQSDTFSVPSAIRLKWIRGFDRITTAGVSVYPPQNKILPLTFKLVYPSSSEASTAADDLSKLIANGSIRRLSGSDDVFSAESSGSTLLVSARIEQ